MPRVARNVWFLAFPGSDLLDVSGPWEVFSHANDVLGHQAYCLSLRAPSAGLIQTRHGLSIGMASALPKRASRLPDIAIVAGGSPKAPPPPGEAGAALWLKRYATKIPIVASVCTGAFVLGEAGLLDGHLATTHWSFVEHLRQRFPAARISTEEIFTCDGGLWTSAGITAGIDLALGLVEQEQGHAIAIQIAKQLVLYLRRSGHQTQFSSMLQRQQRESAPLKEFSRFVLEHIDEALSVNHIATALGMSTRSLTRSCRQTLGQPPAKLVRQYRVDEARRLLESSELPLKAIAARTGLGDVSTLWRVCTQYLGVTPEEYRQRFTAASTARS